MTRGEHINRVIANCYSVHTLLKLSMALTTSCRQKDSRVSHTTSGPKQSGMLMFTPPSDHGGIGTEPSLRVDAGQSDDRV